jgi:hypothetical protein
MKRDTFGAKMTGALLAGYFRTTMIGKGLLSPASLILKRLNALVLPGSILLAAQMT